MFDELVAQSSLFNLVAAIRVDLGAASSLFSRPPAPDRSADPDARVGVSGTLRIRDLAADAEFDARCTITATLR